MEAWAAGYIEWDALSCLTRVQGRRTTPVTNLRTRNTFECFPKLGSLKKEKRFHKTRKSTRTQFFRGTDSTEHRPVSGGENGCVVEVTSSRSEVLAQPSCSVARTHGCSVSTAVCRALLQRTQ